MRNMAKEQRNLRFDRDFTSVGVGRIRVSSGTKKVAEFHRRDAILTKLLERGELDLLRALKDGKISIEQLVNADRNDKLKVTLSEMLLRRPLWETFEQMLPQLGRSEETRRRYETSFDALKRRKIAGLGDNASISDLANVDWKGVCASWGNSPSDWNHAVRAISTFLTHATGDVYDPFRRRVMKMLQKLDEEHRVPDLSVDLFWKIIADMPEHARPGPVVLVVTGMRLKEYLRCGKEHLKPVIHGVQVPGTKTKKSKAVAMVDPRMWPWIESGIPAPLQRNWLRIYWKRACKKHGKEELTLHDLRHCHGQWATDAGMDIKKVNKSLRHATLEMTGRYTDQKDRGEVAAALADVLAPKKKPTPKKKKGVSHLKRVA